MRTSPKTKDKARAWYRDGNEFFNDFCEDDFESFLQKIGFKNVGSQFSGFWSQGDGASFDYKGVDFTKLFNPPETDQGEYRAILDAWLTEHAGTIRKARKFSGSIHAESTRNSYATHYCHSRTRGVSMELDAGGVRDFAHMQKTVTELEKAFDSLCESLADKYYSQLEEEYNWLNADEQVDQAIADNGYTFTAEGKRYG